MKEIYERKPASREEAVVQINEILDDKVQNDNTIMKRTTFVAAALLAAEFGGLIAANLLGIPESTVHNVGEAVMMGNIVAGPAFGTLLSKYLISKAVYKKIRKKLANNEFDDPIQIVEDFQKEQAEKEQKKGR